MAHRVLNGSDEVEAYERYLDEGWPERSEVAVHIAERLAGMDNASPRILELGCGPGALAARILQAVPAARYTGVDISASSLAYARARTAAEGAGAVWLHADLNEDAWLHLVDGPLHAVVSMQSIHDLGGEAEVARMFKIAHSLLAPGGRIVYADLLRSPADEDGVNPGRFFAPRHLGLLHAAGFDAAACTMVTGGFGCFEATRNRDQPTARERSSA